MFNFPLPFSVLVVRSLFSLRGNLFFFSFPIIQIPETEISKKILNAVTNTVTSDIICTTAENKHVCHLVNYNKSI